MTVATNIPFHECANWWIYDYLNARKVLCYQDGFFTRTERIKSVSYKPKDLRIGGNISDLLVETEKATYALETVNTNKVTEKKLLEYQNHGIRCCEINVKDLVDKYGNFPEFYTALEKRLSICGFKLLV